MSSLSDDVIKALLADDAQRASAPKEARGPKVDPTLDRTYPTWYKLSHHSCNSECEHRTQEGNTMGHEHACWNPECVDPRPITDAGRKVVTLVKGQYVCRYCFLAGYLLNGE